MDNRVHGAGRLLDGYESRMAYNLEWGQKKDRLNMRTLGRTFVGVDDARKHMTGSRQEYTY